MCERRVLVPAVVTDIHDTAVSYPSCNLCNSKLLVDPTTDRYHCIKCAVSCDVKSVQWRYRLVLTVADGTTLGKVVVFGKTLDGFFGKSATDFSRSLSDLEQTGYPASSMLSEALLNTFHGKYFYFGFKLTVVSDLEDKLSLKDVIKPENSLYYSQLNCTSNFENVHTLAYQMLACSEGVFATVTDHMRLFVKCLRGHNQSKLLQTPEHSKSTKNHTETCPIKSIANSPFDSSNSYRTVSFGADLDSVRFSFETSRNPSSSFLESEGQGRNKRSILLSRSNDMVESKRNISPSINILNDKEIFLAGEIHTDDFSRCITFDNVNENEDSCFPCIGNFDKSYSFLQSRIPQSMKTGSFAPCFTSNSLCTISSDMSVTKRLDFYYLNKSEASNTSKKVDNELQRRQIATSQRSTVYKSDHTRNAAADINQRVWNKNIAELKFEITNIEDVDLPHVASEKDLRNELHITFNELKSFDDVSNKIVNVSEVRLQKEKVIDEFKMPESEDLDAFYESQFEGIEFTQDVTSEVLNVINDNEGYTAIEHAFKQDIIGEQQIAMEDNEKVKDYKSEDECGKVTTNLKDKDIGSEELPCKGNGKLSSAIKEFVKVNQEIQDIEEFKDFLDSFEECEVVKEMLARKSYVNLSEKNVQQKEINVKNEWNGNLSAFNCIKEIINPDLSVENTSKEEQIVRGKVAHVTHDMNKEISDNLLHEMKESDRVELHLNGDKKGNIENYTDLVKCDHLNTHKISSNLFIKNNGSRFENFDKETRTSKEASEENRWVEKDKAKENVSVNESKNEFSDLDMFFADNSIEQKFETVENEEIRLENSSSKHEIDLDKVMEVKRNDIRDAKDIERDSEEFKNDLELIEYQNSLTEEFEEESNEKVESRMCIETGSNIPKHFRKDYDNCQLQDNDISNDDNDDGDDYDISNSIIEMSSDFEEQKVRISLFKPLNSLKPGKNFLKLELESNKTVETGQEIRQNSKGGLSTYLDSIYRSYPTERLLKLGMNSSDTDIFQEIEKNNDLEITVELTNKLDSKNELNCVNCSADLFEISDGCNEQSSLCVLTVSTPSFTTKSKSENASMNEDLFDDSPVGTSTPALDECIILDSQDMSFICDSQLEKDSEDQLDVKRRVKFDKRLRRVSTCHVMDIRMRLNESPLTRPISAGKSCLKFKTLTLENASGISVKQEHAEKTESTNSDLFIDKAIGKDLGLYSEANSGLKQNLECLDGSFDLFAASFNTLCKSPVNSNYNVALNSDKLATLDKETLRLQHVDVNSGEAVGLKNEKVKNQEIVVLHHAYTKNWETVGLKHENVKNGATVEMHHADVKNGEYVGMKHADVKNRETVGMKHTDVKRLKDKNKHFLNSQDLWLNESTDSFIYNTELEDNKQGLNDKPDKKSMNLETSIKFDAIQRKEWNIDLQKLQNTQAVTPDLFTSQLNEINYPIPTNGKGNDSQCQTFPGKLNNSIDEIEKCTERMAFKCFAINTPDCDSFKVCKQRSIFLKFENHSEKSAKNEVHLLHDGMKENIDVSISPDIFGDSILDGDVKTIFDRKTAVFDKNSVLCKKLFF